MGKQASKSVEIVISSKSWYDVEGNQNVPYPVIFWAFEGTDFISSDVSNLLFMAKLSKITTVIPTVWSSGAESRT